MELLFENWQCKYQIYITVDKKSVINDDDKMLIIGVKLDRFKIKKTTVGMYSTDWWSVEYEINIKSSEIWTFWIK